MTDHKCLRCGYVWDSRKEIVKMCPKCKTYKWNDMPVNKEVIKAINE
jgi:predicted  nucleic acid-binding Zn-ribbon protein